MKSESFDLINSPLGGINLIEASAGTGKTYTIAGLYLRIVLEKRIPVEKILVVTFTEAATQELKDRIRNRLKDAYHAFVVNHSDDPLVESSLKKTLSVEHDREWLKDAIRSFDQAAVYTIHGFCQRMLVENAFESGSLFETELITDISKILRAVILDFVRTHIYTESSAFVDYLVSKKIGPDEFIRFVKDTEKPGIQFIPDFVRQDFSDHVSRFNDLFDRVKAEWLNSGKDVSAILEYDPSLKKNSYNPKNIPSWRQSMDDYMNSESPGFILPENFSRWTTTEINRNTKKGCTAPAHSFFDLCGDFLDAFKQLSAVFEHHLRWLKRKAVSYTETTLSQRMRLNGKRSFDDLLKNLHGGLYGPNGNLLAERIRNKYQVALIDEFQDTDSLQYGIFSNVFNGRNHPLFMIGDPKQAIYGFRGADIFAYLKAASCAENRYSLGKNYRSDAGLIKAVNTFFELDDSPFVFPEINFYPAQPPDGKNSETFHINEGDPSPFQILYLPGGDKPLLKKSAGENAEKAVAKEMVRLLELSGKGLASIDGRSVMEKDMAVLVRTNKEAQSMKTELSRWNVASVIYDTGNVFSSDEAHELFRIMQAMASPMNKRLVISALATEMLGVTADQILDADHSREFDMWSDRFQSYHTEWNRSGFISGINGLIKEWNVKPRLMTFEDGNRRNTNLAHLIQLLHCSSLEENMGPAGLINWFESQIHSENEKEEHQLRLESDTEAVTIVTIHKSKGMEYPIVFLPYAWNFPVFNDNDDYCVFHRKEDMSFVCDMGSPLFDMNKALSEREKLAEHVRLFYVALTRARNRCYLVWGRVKNTEKTAMSYLISRHNGMMNYPENDFLMMNILNSMKQKSDGNIHVSVIHDEEMDRYSPGIRTHHDLVLKQFKGEIDHTYRITSYSALTSGFQQKTIPQGEADRDRINKDISQSHSSDESDIKTIFSFPKGARTGTFLHEIFEHADFTSDDAEISKLVSEKIDIYGFETAWVDVLSGMIKNVLETPLIKDDKGFTLSTIKPCDRLNELEFYFPLKLIQPFALESVFARHGVPGFQADELNNHKREKLDFSPVKGFMKGFIDLVFRRKNNGTDQYFIVDWKSNHLGDSIEDYSVSSIERIMVEEQYVLQYHLYVTALHRFLALKYGDEYDYARHFGGVFYVFLRGVSPGNAGTHGIFMDRPDPGLVNDLAACLLEVL